MAVKGGPVNLRQLAQLAHCRFLLLFHVKQQRFPQLSLGFHMQLIAGRIHSSSILVF
jgi:hypothetical protein